MAYGFNRLVTPPYAEPIDIGEAKLHCSFENDGDEETDRIFLRLIRQARKCAEQATGRCLVVATWRQYMDRFPEQVIDLKWGPLLDAASVSITYLDSSGVRQTLATTSYVVNTSNVIGTVQPVYSGTWPTCRYFSESVQITYQAGYAVPFTAAPSSDICTYLGHAFAANDQLTLRNSGGKLPGPLAEDTPHFVVTVSGSTSKLSLTSGGVAIDITEPGGGTHYACFQPIPDEIIQGMMLLISKAWSNREDDEGKMMTAADLLFGREWTGCYG